MRRLLVVKALYWVGVLGTVWFCYNIGTDDRYRTMAHWPWQGARGFASHLATWDGAHYLHLSEVGYKHNDPSCAFYPLWPLLVRWTAPCFGRDYLVAGLVWANVFSLAGWAVLQRLVARRHGETAANWSVGFLITFPGALFFEFIYTESLFLLLVLWIWWMVEKQRYGWAWVAGALLPLTRGIGVFVLLPIASHVLAPALPWLRALGGRESPAADRCPEVAAANSEFRDQSSHFREEQHESASFPFRAILSRTWLLAAPLAGWAAYLSLMWHWTGNPLEGFDAQKHWAVHSVSNLWNVPKFVVGFFSPTQWHEFRGSVLDRCVFILLLNCLPVIWRLDKRLLVWTYVLGILPAMSGTFTSYTRFASCCFPMFIALGVFLSRPEWRWLRYGLLAVFAVLHVLLLWRFVNFRWAG